MTETTVITETTTITEERYKPQNPEAMNETMFSDSEDEGWLFHFNIDAFQNLLYWLHLFVSFLVRVM